MIQLVARVYYTATVKEVQVPVGTIDSYGNWNTQYRSMEIAYGSFTFPTMQEEICNNDSVVTRGPTSFVR